MWPIALNENMYFRIIQLIQNTLFLIQSCDSDLLPIIYITVCLKQVRQDMFSGEIEAMMPQRMGYQIKFYTGYLYNDRHKDTGRS